MNSIKKILCGVSMALALTATPAAAQTVLPGGALPMIVTPHSQTVSYRERTLCLNIHANVEYTMASDQTWATLRKGTDGTVYLHIPTNYDTAERTANITFTSADGTITQTFAVTQEADGSAADLPTDEAAYDIFADDLFTTLKAGTTADDIEAIDNPFVKSLATKIYDGTYATDYRVASFPCLLNVTTLSNLWNAPGKLYDQMSGVTGISFAPGTYAVVVRDLPQGKTITLKIVSWYVGKTGGNFDGGNPYTLTYTLSNGVNQIDYHPETATSTFVLPWQSSYNGLGYIVYDDTTDPDSYPDVRVHFVNGTVNGYLSEDKTNAEMHQLTANAPNSHMDVVSKKVHAVWSSSGLNKYCKSVSGGLGYKQYMNVLDSLIQWEHDLLGFTKYDRLPENRTFAYVNYTYYMFQDGLGVSFHVDQESRVLNCNTLINNDNDAIWGLSHEWGHQHQMHPYFCWKGMGEVTNNMNAYYNIMKMGYTTSDKIDNFPKAYKIFIDDNISGLSSKISSYRTNAYNNRSSLSWNQTYYNLATEMKDDTIRTQAVNALRACGNNECGTVETLTPFVKLFVYFTRDKGMKDFTPDWYEALRQTDQEGGSTVEKQDGVDKYELIAAAQNSNKNGALAKLKDAYPTSVWNNYITTSHCSQNDNTMPFILNYIRKVSRLSGYNLFPYFERWGFLRNVCLYIGDYGDGWLVFPKEAYDEFKADMDALVANGTLKEMPDGMVEEISAAANWFQSKPNIPNE